MGANGQEFNNESLFKFNCSVCENQLCLKNEDYEFYQSYINVDTFEMVLMSLIGSVFIIGICGNSLVFIAVTTTKSMQSVTNLFIVNLAMADMLVMLFCVPPTVIWDVTNTWIFGSLMCRVVLYIQDISVSVSVLTLTFIAYDRYHAICRPLHFSSKKNKAIGVMGAIWTISAIIGIPNAISLEAVTPFDDPHVFPCIEKSDIFFDLSTCKPTWSDDIDFTITIFKAVILYTIPILFMSTAYYHIVRTLWHRNRMLGNCENEMISSVRPSCNSSSMAYHNGGNESGNVSRRNSNNNKSMENQLRARRKVAKMLIAVVIMFTLNSFPVHCLPIAQYILSRDPETYEKVNWFLLQAGIFTHCMFYFNSAINPIIYYFMSAQFKTQYRRILSCRCNGNAARSSYVLQERILMTNRNTIRNGRISQIPSIAVEHCHESENSPLFNNNKKLNESQQLSL